jgi:DNA-binding CsgD family transcriptional regulator
MEVSRKHEVLTEKLRPLVQQLTRVAGEAGRTAEDGAGDGTELLLDLEVDGVRCVLVREAPQPGSAALSPRELEIARLVAAGHPNKIIAAELDISAWTVGTHLRRIFAKLGVGSRAAMVARTTPSRLRAG